MDLSEITILFVVLVLGALLLGVLIRQWLRSVKPSGKPYRVEKWD